MKFVYGMFACASIIYLAACGDPNMASENGAVDAAVSASLTGQLICNKSMPPQCSIDGKAVQTTSTGQLIKDSAGNPIFK